MAVQQRVLIVGAGPTGLTLALSLRRLGIECRLIDKEPAPSVHSKALAVQARTLEVFERLGVVDRFLASGHPIRGACFHMGGRALARLQFRGVHSGFPSVLSLPQAETERILIDAAAAPARGVRFVGHDVRGDEIVARLLHADGREEEALCNWLVGCDGAHSSVRHALRAGFSGMRYAETFLLADCRIDGLDSDSIHAFLDRAATLAFFPLPGGAWRAIRVLERDEQPPELRSLAMFEQPHLNLADLMWWSSFQVSRWIVERYDFGHVLLAGDAAHIHSPVGGQGMNLGIQDAYALACALRDGTVAEWAKQRRAVARRVLSATDLATRLLSLRGSIACSVRMSVLRWVASRPSLAGRLEHGLAGMGYPSIPN